MIIFFGTRPGKTEYRPLQAVSCPHCEQTGTLTFAKTSNWFHFFWIKLFRISSNQMVECSHCKRVFYRDEFNKGMLDAITQA